MSKSSSVTSVKYRKLFLGIIISIVFGIAGAVIWIFGESGVRMNGSMKDLAMVFFAVEGIPAVVFYIIWYLKDAKKRPSAGRRPSLYCTVFCARRNSIVCAYRCYVDYSVPEGDSLCDNHIRSCSHWIAYFVSFGLLQSRLIKLNGG